MEAALLATGFDPKGYLPRYYNTQAGVTLAGLSVVGAAFFDPSRALLDVWHRSHDDRGDAPEQQTLAAWFAFFDAHGFDTTWLNPIKPAAINTNSASAEGQAAPAPAKHKPVARMQAQEALILQTIRDAGHDPLNLPPRPIGKGGVKAQTRATLLKRCDVFSSRTVFDSAWKRLKGVGDIGDEGVE